MCRTINDRYKNSANVFTLIEYYDDSHVQNPLCRKILLIQFNSKILEQTKLNFIYSFNAHLCFYFIAFI